MLTSLVLATAVKLTFVGDALCHGPMLEAYRSGTNRYDFSSVFADVRPLFAASDFVVANLETPIAPDNQGLTRERWSFCSPKEFAVALKDAGVDFVFTANNHCLDRGPEGVKRTIAALDEIGLPHTGTFATPAAAEEPSVIDVGGFKIGLMSATYGSNAFSNHQYLDDGNRFMVNLFQDQELSEPDARAWFRDRNSAEGRSYAAREAKRWPDNLTLQVYERIENHDRQRTKIRADVAKMRARNPDFILMGMHAGGQYNAVETQYTKELASFLCGCGIDWLVGAHEHVVHGSDFSGFRDGRLVTYSLGNFDALSGTWIGPYDKMSDWSIAWHVYLTRDASGRARVERTTFTVLRTVKGEKPNTIRVVPAADLYARERDEARKSELKAGIAEIARRFCGRDFSREPVALEHELQPSRPSVR